MKYEWHVVLNNGKEYDILTNYSSVVDFMTNITQKNSFSDYELKDKSQGRNMVMINGGQISSVEYRTE